jgi:hypothetical protein
MNQWIAVFRTGRHTESMVPDKEWTEADLHRIAEYDPPSQGGEQDEKNAILHVTAPSK